MKTCPFCRGVGEEWERGKRKWVQCASCGAKASPEVWDGPRKLPEAFEAVVKAIPAKWPANRRLTFVQKTGKSGKKYTFVALLEEGAEEIAPEVGEWKKLM